MFTRAQEDPAVQREFQAFSARTERVRTLAGTAVAIVFWLFFSYLDFEIYPEELSVLLPLRLAVLTVFLVTFAITFGSTSYSWIIGSAAFAWTIATVAIAVMCHVAEGYASPYYVGIIFCAVFAGSVLLWPAWLVAACFVATLLVYYGPLLLGAPLGDSRVFLLNTAFLLATLAVSVLAAGFRRRLAFAAFSSRRDLARSHRELQLLDASKNRMFQNVSHELRTPLTLMLSPLQRGLESNPPRGVEPKQTATLYRHGLRLLKQVDDLLSLAQLSSQKLPVRRSALNLNQFLADLVNDALDAAEDHDSSLTKRLPRLAAVKRVTSRKTGASHSRLRSEINALTRLDHDSIVKILGGYEQEGEWFLAMEYLSGTTVTALLEQGGPLPPQVAAAIGSRVALALDAVHRAGLLHRDVKCSNIMLLTKRPIVEGVRLVDFGSAAIRGQNATKVRGTPPYVAPEVALGNSGAGPLSDIYSLGVALFRMCTGHLPCSATNEEALRELWQQDSPPRISEGQPEVAPSLDEAVARAMDRSPARRWQSAAELAAVLSGETGGSESTALQFTAIQPDILTPTDSVSSWGS